MNLLRKVIGIAFVVSLVACGGGGGNPGSTSNGGTSSVSTSTVTGLAPSTSAGDTEVTTAGAVSVELLSGAGAITQSISAVEIAQARVTVKDSTGAPVVGTIVTFTESGAGLLSFTPASKTDMTNSQGVAVVEIRAGDPTKTGATTVLVSATVAKQAISAVKNLLITNAPVTGGVPVDPQTLASAINFVSTDPADKAIVLQGAGGNGRTETGILKFRVVDKNGTPVKGASVDFVVNPSADVTLNIAQGKTDGDGIVLTSVSSKTVPTAVVVKGSVTGTLISSQSDQLKVTTGLGVANGFEILPLVYNLDGALSGDSTSITARLVDVNSNPVADGVPVVMVSTGGKIGTSSAGGCNTLNGACTLTFEVQEPRPINGIVTVTGSAKVGETTTLLRQLNINMSSASLGMFADITNGGLLPMPVPAAPLNPLSALTVTGCGKQTVNVMVANTSGYSVPSGATLSAQNDSATGLGASIPDGNLVLDVPNFGASVFGLSIDPKTANNPPCDPDGISSSTGLIGIAVDAPKSKRKTKTQIPVTYPSGQLVLISDGTASDEATIFQGCSALATRMQAIGSNQLTLPAGSKFIVSATDSTAVVTVSTVLPPALNDTLGAPSNSASRQSIWLTVTPPSGGIKPCKETTPSSGLSASFTAKVTISTNGKINTKSVTVTYPVEK